MSVLPWVRNVILHVSRILFDYALTNSSSSRRSSSIQVPVGLALEYKYICSTNLADFWPLCVHGPFTA